MRLLQLVTGPDELLDLHPHVTIVQGLSDEVRERLVRAVRGLADGSAVAAGLLEAHGVLFALDQRYLDELELGGRHIDPIVRRDDLPGQHGAVDAGELATQQAVFASLLDRIAQRAEEQSKARDELAAAATALEQARVALDAAKADADHVGGADPAVGAGDHRLAVEARLHDEWAEHEAATAARDALEAQLAPLHEAADVAVARTLSVIEALEQVDEDEDEDEPAEHLAPETSTPPDPTPAAADGLAELDARLAALDNRLAVLDRGDVGQIQEALGLLRAASAMVPSAEARSLADDIESLDARLADEALAEASAATIAAARSRLEDARQSLLEAEQAARSPVLSRADVEAIEQVHEALLDAIERSDARFSGGRAHRRVEERRAAEQEVLDRVGFRSYADYVMGSSTRQADPGLGVALAAARAELQEAEDAWRALSDLAEEELARAARLDARRELSERATARLGRRVERSDEPEALRALRVAAVAPASAVAALRSALDAAGVDLGSEELDVEDLTLLAEASVEAARDGEARRLQLIEERADLDVERRRLAESADAAPVGAGPTGTADEGSAPDPAAAPHPSDRRDGPARAELEAELASARELERAAVEARDAVGAELEAADAAVTALAALVRASEAELASTPEPTDAGPAPDRRVDELAAVVASAEEEHQRALQRVESEDRELAALDDEGRSLAVQIERQAELVSAQDAGVTTTTDELEWYLLARVAGQRSVSVAGSLPLVVLDDALGVVEPEGVRRLLDRLERMADAVQVIVVSDDPALVTWVDDVGPARAAVVRVTAA